MHPGRLHLLLQADRFFIKLLFFSSGGKLISIEGFPPFVLILGSQFQCLLLLFIFA